MNRELFLGYPADNLTIGEALVWIEGAIGKNTTSTIAVLNANKLWNAQRNLRLRVFLKNADLVIPEYAVVWGARKLGQFLTHVGGIGLLQAFLPFAENRHIRPYFLGAREEVLFRAIKNIQVNFPKLDISGWHHGYLTNDHIKNQVIEEIQQKNPDILFIAMGSPKQEDFMMELKELMNIPVLMGVGGSLDVFSGDKKDAPAWARSKGFEWLYRIMQDPFNLAYYKRYLLTNSWFVYQVYKHKYLCQ